MRFTVKRRIADGRRPNRIDGGLQHRTIGGVERPGDARVGEKHGSLLEPSAKPRQLRSDAGQRVMQFTQSLTGLPPGSGGSGTYGHSYMAKSPSTISLHTGGTAGPPTSPTCAATSTSRSAVATSVDTFTTTSPNRGTTLFDLCRTTHELPAVPTNPDTARAAHSIASSTRSAAGPDMTVMLAGRLADRERIRYALNVIPDGKLWLANVHRERPRQANLVDRLVAIVEETDEHRDLTVSC